jgi:hypothetical protein
MRTEEALIRVLTALVRLEADLGSEAFDMAARRALLAIANVRQSAVLEAEEAIVPKGVSEVVDLTAFRRRRRAPPETGDDAPA